MKVKTLKKVGVPLPAKKKAQLEEYHRKVINSCSPEGLNQMVEAGEVIELDDAMAAKMINDGSVEAV